MIPFTQERADRYNIHEAIYIEAHTNGKVVRLRLQNQTVCLAVCLMTVGKSHDYSDQTILQHAINFEL